MTRGIYMNCCVCGSFAGYHKQHPNRDTGYGICAPCAARQSGLETPEAMVSLYGKAGVNYEQPTHILNGRRFKVLASFHDSTSGTKRANAYMERNPSAAVLFVGNGDIILADKADMGVSLVDELVHQ